MKLFAVIEEDLGSISIIAVFKKEKYAENFVDALPKDDDKHYDIQETVLIE